MCGWLKVGVFMKRLALCVALGVLTGCVSNAPKAPISSIKSEVSYNSFSAVQYQALDILDGSIKVQADISPLTFNLKMDGQESAVLGWKVPTYGVYKITLNSQIKRSNFGRTAVAFMPDVLLLDSQFNIIRSIDAVTMKYQKPALMAPEMLSQTFSIDNRNPVVPPVEYILVKTSDEARQHSVEVVDMDKEYAKVRGQTPPLTADIFTRAAEEGTITLDVEPLATGYYARSPEVKIPASPSVTKTFTGIDTPAVVTDVQFDTLATSRDFASAVREKLNAGDVTKALEMRRFVGELKMKTEQLFTKLYQQPVGNIVVENALIDTTTENKLAYHYEQQMKMYFKQGHKQMALKLIDQINDLSNQVDRMF